MEFAVFSRRILTGTVSDLPPAVRIAWITVLFEAEKLRGKVKLPVRDLAKMASISTPEAAEALRVFQEPDPYSSTKEHEGRRLLPVDGEEDWYIVATWEKHAEERALFFARLRQQRSRARNAASRPVTESNGASRSVTKEPEPEPTPELREKKPESTFAGAREGISGPKEEPKSDAVPVPDFDAVKGVDDKLAASALKVPPPHQVTAAWVSDYGEELIVETLADCEDQYKGKHFKYLESILTNRRDNPDQRPGNRRARRTDGENGRGRGTGRARSDAGEAPPVARNPLGDFGMRDGRDVIRELKAKRELQEMQNKPSS